MPVSSTQYTILLTIVLLHYYFTSVSGSQDVCMIVVDVDVVDLRAQADASMPASNNNVNYTI